MLSFQPNVGSSTHTPRVEKKNDMNKWDELHHQSTNRQPKRDLTQDEIELARNKNHYTFQPNAHKYKNSIHKQDDEPKNE